MKINVKDHNKLAAAIAAAEGPRCSARGISPAAIQSEVGYITDALDARLSQQDQVGARVGVDLNAQTFPNAYKGIPYSTQFTVERFPTGWFVTCIVRGRCRTNRRRLDLSSEQREAMADRIVREF